MQENYSTRFREISRASLGAIAVGAIVFGLSTPAAAATEPDHAGQALNSLTARSSSPSTDVLKNVAQVPTTESGSSAISAAIAGSKVTIPTDPSDAILIDHDDKKPFTVKLPFSATASDAVVVANGVVGYNNRNGSTTAPVLKEDGSVQITTVIEAVSSPTRYSYAFDLPNDATIEEFGDSLLIMDGDELLGGIAPAWAKDSLNRSVPTHYEVSGTTVTQVVEHTGSEFAYPVVADPWLGASLFSKIAMGSYQSQPMVNLDLSGWGILVWTGVAQGGGPIGFMNGQLILNSAGWDEAWTYSSTVRSALNKPSMRQQFECHALGAPAAGTWNLEKSRVNRTNGDWQKYVAVHHCNWTTVHGY